MVGPGWRHTHRCAGHIGALLSPAGPADRRPTAGRPPAEGRAIMAKPRAGADQGHRTPRPA